MTNEQLALLLDPRREKPGWWVKVPFVRALMWRYTGPDYHASDDACFRDWRPVLLAAGCIIEEGEEYNAIFIRSRNGGNEESVWQQTYRAAILAAIEELHTTKPELLREAIARVNKGE